MLVLGSFQSLHRIWPRLSRKEVCKQDLRGIHCIRVQSSRERPALMARLPSRNTAVSVPKYR